MNVRKTVGLAATAILLAIGPAQASTPLTNGDFETGDLSGWTVFTTAAGTTGSGLPDVVMFDTDGDGFASHSARFNVGRLAPIGPREGGGIYQVVTLSGGDYTLSTYAAMLDDNGRNADGGLVELMFDGVVLDSYDFGVTTLGVTQHAFLSGLQGVLAGPHEVRIRITRLYGQNNTTPYQYIDAVSLTPEPATLALLALGGLAMLRGRRRKN